MQEPRTDGGFTLIELLVVVLIVGTLMAIAIPTFLSLTSSSRSNAAEANITVAGTDEAAFLLKNSVYGTTTGSPSIASVDPGINWQTCTTGQSSCVADNGGMKDVYVATGSDGSFQAVVVGDAGSAGRYYWEMETQSPSGPSPLFQVVTSAAVPTIASFQASPYRSWTQAGG